jgi:hypothetical protein
MVAGVNGTGEGRWIAKYKNEVSYVSPALYDLLLHLAVPQVVGQTLSDGTVMTENKARALADEFIKSIRSGGDLSLAPVSNNRRKAITDNFATTKRKLTFSQEDGELPPPKKERKKRVTKAALGGPENLLNKGITKQKRTRKPKVVSMSAGEAMKEVTKEQTFMKCIPPARPHGVTDLAPFSTIQGSKGFSLYLDKKLEALENRDANDKMVEGYFEATHIVEML